MNIIKHFKTLLSTTGLILFLLFFQVGIPHAATVSRIVSGQSVLTDGVEKARKESISDALGKALNNFIFGDMAVNHKYEPQVGSTFLKNRNYYINKFEIQSERKLGELYQIELKVDLKSDLIERDLKKIEQLKQRTVKNLTLVILAPKAALSVSDLETDTEELVNQVLEPSSLEIEMKQQLAVYGFNLNGSGKLSNETTSMLGKLFEDSELQDNSYLQAAMFKDLLPGDLIIVIRPAAAREEQIVSLQKSFWHGEVEIIFIDMKNDAIISLPIVNAKVINSDYVAGMENLTKELTSKVNEAVAERLLRDYIVPGEHEEEVFLKCVGFQQPADFNSFKESLNSLRTVKEVSLSGLTARTLELKIKTLNSADLLALWINHFKSANSSYKLKTTEIFPTAKADNEISYSTELIESTPRHYLVQVINSAAAGL